ncbi:MAG: hypothetical protein GX335_06990 [Firmicutes bacterium]|nr:hypothetical protein [Bacillota bacterium]
MRNLILSILFLFFCAGQCFARISVSPVVIEAEQVPKGASFLINCLQLNTQPVDVRLSLALFDQDEKGQIYFLEDKISIQKANSLLALENEGFRLEPGEEKNIKVEVARDFEDSVYAVLFVKPLQKGMPMRLAVLFLLSAGKAEEKVVLTSWTHWEQSLDLRVENQGRSPGLWLGEVLFYDSGGNLGKKMEVQSGVVLAGRTRDLRINLPSWVEAVDLRPRKAGLER